MERFIEFLTSAAGYADEVFSTSITIEVRQGHFCVIGRTGRYNASRAVTFLEVSECEVNPLIVAIDRVVADIEAKEQS